MKDLISTSRLLPRKSHDRIKDAPPWRPSLRLSVRFLGANDSGTPPSPTSGPKDGKVIGTHLGDGASRSHPSLATSSVAAVNNMLLPSSTSRSPMTPTPPDVSSDPAKAPVQPSAFYPLVVELPGSILMENQGFSYALDDQATEHQAQWEHQKPSVEPLMYNPLRHSEDSMTSRSASSSPFTTGQSSEMEVSPVTLNSGTTSPLSPHLKVHRRTQERPLSGGKTEMMEVNSEAKRVALTLGRRVHELEVKLREREDVISDVKDQLQKLQACHDDNLQRWQDDVALLAQAMSAQPSSSQAFRTDTEGAQARSEYDSPQEEIRALRETVQQRDDQVASLEQEILCWRDDIDALEGKVELFADMQRNYEAELTGANERAFATLERHLVDGDFSIQPLQPKHDGENLAALLSPPISSDGGAGPPARIQRLEEEVKYQAEHIRLYKLDVKCYKKDVRERDAKIKELQHSILDLQARLGDAEGEVLLSEVPLGIDLSSAFPIPPPPPTVHAPPVAPLPRTPEPETPTPPPRATRRPLLRSRPSARTRAPRCDTIIEESLPDSPTLPDCNNNNPSLGEVIRPPGSSPPPRPPRPLSSSVMLSPTHTGRRQRWQTARVGAAGGGGGGSGSGSGDGSPIFIRPRHSSLGGNEKTSSSEPRLGDPFI